MSKKNILSFGVICLMLGNLAQADYFAPENDLYIPADQKGLSVQSSKGLTENEFWLAIDTVEKAMQPVLKRLNRKVTISANWYDGTVNASASQNRIFLSGGLARFGRISLGAYMGVICHEYGHALSMRPLWRRSTLSSEGQSDYYAGLKCLRDVFKNNRRLFLSNFERARISRKHVNQCNRNQKTWIDRQTCSSTLHSGEIMAQVLHQITYYRSPKINWPRLSTPSLLYTTYTINNDYPDSQCRLDTIVAGALCPTAKLRETATAGRRYQISCADKKYIQPACWFLN